MAETESKRDYYTRQAIIETIAVGGCLLLSAYVVGGMRSWDTSNPDTHFALILGLMPAFASVIPLGFLARSLLTLRRLREESTTEK